MRSWVCRRDDLVAFCGRATCSIWAQIVDFHREKISEEVVDADNICWRAHRCMDHLEKVCVRSPRPRSPTTPAVMIAEEPFSSDGLHLFGKL